MQPTGEIAVVGHVCLDVIPTFLEGTGPALAPGTLVKVGPALRSTGGAVSNTGLALHRLGVKVRLLGKVGADLFGREVLAIMESQGTGLASGMIVTPGETTSYSIVLSPPGVDRMFLHCPGANDTFSADDVDPQRLRGARLLHFGYPPLMRRMYLDQGNEVKKILARAKTLQITTSLDMASVDAQSECGQVDWTTYLRNVLPLVDVFAPSVEELLYMLEHDTWELLWRQHGKIDIAAHLDAPTISRLAERSLEMGAAVVLIKLGDQGVYVRTTPDQQRIKQMGLGGPANVAAWTNRRAATSCYQVAVAGTTGSGDCTIAGFLAGLLAGQSPEEASASAVGTGACSVERPDATSGVPTWAQLRTRIEGGWKKLPSVLGEKIQ